MPRLPLWVQYVSVTKWEIFILNGTYPSDKRTEQGIYQIHHQCHRDILWWDSQRISISSRRWLSRLPLILKSVKPHTTATVHPTLNKPDCIKTMSRHPRKFTMQFALTHSILMPQRISWKATNSHSCKAREDSSLNGCVQGKWYISMQSELRPAAGRPSECNNVHRCQLQPISHLPPGATGKFSPFIDVCTPVQNRPTWKNIPEFPTEGHQWT